jgi:hypothetical protein
MTEENEYMSIEDDDEITIFAEYLPVETETERVFTFEEFENFVYTLRLYTNEKNLGGVKNIKCVVDEKTILVTMYLYGFSNGEECAEFYFDVDGTKYHVEDVFTQDDLLKIDLKRYLTDCSE